LTNQKLSDCSTKLQ